MNRSRAISTRARRRLSGGFSLVELAISLAILLVLSGVAIPTLMRTYRSYVLGDASSRFAGIVKLTRFEAIRMNRNVSFRVRAQGADWIVWLDRDGDGTAQSTEPQMLITGMVRPLAGGVPGLAPITAVVGSTPAVLSGADAAVTYDPRGSVSPGVLYVFFLGNTTIPDFGARAVVLLPSGIVQVWSAPPGGTWIRLG